MEAAESEANCIWPRRHETKHFITVAIANRYITALRVTSLRSRCS